MDILIVVLDLVPLGIVLHPHAQVMIRAAELEARFRQINHASLISNDFL